ncbi:hypothetical protein XMD530_002112 [Marinobacterium sp. xm-d-530]|nr:hypothetical protein [Marinobacterium sp. xm-a-152]NRP95072.1 hypothetical protein [Marinobacterium sp. xm-g-59]NRQ02870.1 hypothetical protein [Marinobacterium sp. xm-d-530]
MGQHSSLKGWLLSSAEEVAPWILTALLEQELRRTIFTSKSKSN